jgi:transposase
MLPQNFPLRRAFPGVAHANPQQFYLPSSWGPSSQALGRKAYQVFDDKWRYRKVGPSWPGGRSAIDPILSAPSRRSEHDERVRITKCWMQAFGTDRSGSQQEGTRGGRMIASDRGRRQLRPPHQWSCASPLCKRGSESRAHSSGDISVWLSGTVVIPCRRLPICTARAATLGDIKLRWSYFPTFTEDLHRLADWLKKCGVETVAMESTSVYWIPLFQILEARNFEVCLVNARYFQNVPGRRTDVSDCQWLRYLHSVGLLRPSFRPADQVCVLRSPVRHRDSLIQTAATHVLRMQKALDQMNLQIHHVISDITGLTGLRIIDAILAGKRDAKELAALRDARIKATEETIIKSLVGDYRREHLFTLRQSLAAYRSYQKLVAECDREIEQQLKLFDDRVDRKAKPLAPPKVRRHKLFGNEPSFDLRGHLYRIFGVDLTEVPGINILTAHTLLAEVGPDLSRFSSASAFASWLGLCPDNVSFRQASARNWHCFSEGYPGSLLSGGGFIGVALTSRVVFLQPR